VDKKENYMNQEPTDLEQTNGQIHPKAFHYKVKIEGSSEPSFVTVIAVNASSSRRALEQHPAFSSLPASYYGRSDYIIQIND